MTTKQNIALPELEFEPPAGFLWSGVEASLKHAGRLDIGLIQSVPPATCAAVFTQNRFAAAPVIVSKEILRDSSRSIGGIITNSGIANAATGGDGFENARSMARLASDDNSAAPFLVCSTGTIGLNLPMDRVSAGIARARETLASTPDAFLNFSDAILTTDTHRKISFKSLIVEGKTVRILGCAKGSGMINPNMATMLAYVMTDALLDQPLLNKIFTTAIEHSLNCLTVDGDTSTNDSALILANGASEVTIQAESAELREFQAALTAVLQSLARQLARDGEGATKLIEVTVRNARSFEEARTAAKAVANSPLVKTAIYGRDANWGRIACALGNSGVEFDPSQTDISMGTISLLHQGAPVAFDEAVAAQMLTQERIIIDADLHEGTEAATVWTCDLTEKYIEINGHYRT